MNRPEILERFAMNNIDRITKVIDQISLWSGRAASWLIIPMAAVLIWEVFIRYTSAPW